MRLSGRLEPFNSEEFLYELKIDGFRSLAYYSGIFGEPYELSCTCREPHYPSETVTVVIARSSLAEQK